MDTNGYIWIQNGYKMDTSMYQFKSTNCAGTPLPLLLILDSNLRNKYT